MRTKFLSSLQQIIVSDRAYNNLRVYSNKRRFLQQLSLAEELVEWNLPFVQNGQRAVVPDFQGYLLSHELELEGNLEASTADQWSSVLLRLFALFLSLKTFHILLFPVLIIGRPTL